MIALLIIGALVALLWLARRNRQRIIKELAAQHAWRLPPCAAVIRRSMSRLWLPGASVFVLNDGVVVLTINGALKIFRGVPRERFDCTADGVTLEGATLVIRFSGFAAGSVSLKGLASADQQRIMKALNSR